MTRLAMAMLLSLAAAPAAAAPPSCRDLLLAHGSKLFSCDLTMLDTAAGPPFSRTPAALVLQFSELTPSDPAAFALRILGGSDSVCACGARGTADDPSFLGARTFTCRDENGSITQGQVSGKNGNRIKSLTTQLLAAQADGGSQIAVGSCGPHPTPTPPTPTPRFSCGVPNPGPTDCDDLP